jgi:hypothetical protein
VWKSALIGVLLLAPTLAEAKSSHRVGGYVTKRGGYVTPHRATNPDRTRLNNWSSKPNVNPYTGKAGTRNPFAPARRRSPGH